MLSLGLLTWAHVPTYLQSENNCFTPGHLDYRLSQVVYIKGTGGIELHVEDANPPLPTDGDGVDVYFDIVLKRGDVDLTELDVYVGCGGCMPDEMLVPASKREGSDLVYQPFTMEPFTQTGYYSIFPPDAGETLFRSFKSTVLSPANCVLTEPDGSAGTPHLTVRLIDRNTARDSNPDTKLVWGAVLGRAEAFTAQELISFPIYVLNNHGAIWNDVVTWPYTLLGAFVLVGLWRRLATLLRRGLYGKEEIVKPTGVLGRAIHYLFCCGSLLQVSQRSWKTETNNKRYYSMRKTNPREMLYYLAVVGFNFAGLEMFVHLVIAQGAEPLGAEFWTGIVLIFASQVVPCWGISAIWNSITQRSTLKTQGTLTDGCGGVLGGLFQEFHYEDGTPELKGDPWKVRRRFKLFCVRYWAMAQSPFWFWLEMGTGISLFFWFGAGFFVSPCAVILASLLRLFEYRCFKKSVVNRIGLGGYDQVNEARSFKEVEYAKEEATERGPGPAIESTDAVPYAMQALSEALKKAQLSPGKAPGHVRVGRLKSRVDGSKVPGLFL